MGWGWHFNGLIDISWALAMCQWLSKWLHCLIEIEGERGVLKHRSNSWSEKRKLQMPGRTLPQTVCPGSRHWESQKQGTVRAMVGPVLERDGEGKVGGQASCLFPPTATSSHRRQHWMPLGSLVCRQSSHLVNMNCLLCTPSSKY